MPGKPRTSLRRKGTRCARGHRLTKMNTRTWTDRLGRIHGKCRRCERGIETGEYIPYDWRNNNVNREQT